MGNLRTIPPFAKCQDEDSSVAADASSATAPSAALASGPNTSSVVALSDALISAAALIGSALAAGFLGTDLDTFLTGLGLDADLAGADVVRAFLRRAR